jgi:HD superfamily phosphohydrolase
MTFGRVALKLNDREKRKFPTDKLWVDDRSLLDGQTWDVEPEDKVDYYGAIPALDSRQNRIQGYELTHYLNPVGIKDRIKPSESRLHHKRFNHSRGAAFVGQLYLDRLRPEIAETIFCGLSDGQEDRLGGLLYVALLLHDSGHLPFSHLMEEVFNELRWRRTPGMDFRHDESSLPDDKEGVIEVLKEIKGCPALDGETLFSLVENLKHGESGVPFLDAIVNGPLDADKIDYIFRDLKYTHIDARMRKAGDWVRAFLADISLSPTGLVRLNDRAGECALELLEERQSLYRRYYLSPELRVFERLAATIIMSWLVRNMSSQLDLPRSIRPDLSVEKGRAAIKLLLDRLHRSEYNEWDMLISICAELGDAERLGATDFSDQESRDWFAEMHEKVLSRFDGQDTELAEELFDEMVSGEALYVKRRFSETVRKIARDLFIDYPCGALIDIAEFPTFLAYPSKRRYQAGGGSRTGEQFLAQNRRVDLWRRKGVGKVPLGECDFSPMEFDLLQIVVFDSIPGLRRADYIRDLLVRRCKLAGVEFLGGNPWNRGA